MSTVNELLQIVASGLIRTEEGLCTIYDLICRKMVYEDYSLTAVEASCLKELQGYILKLQENRRVTVESPGAVGETKKQQHEPGDNVINALGESQPSTSRPMQAPPTSVHHPRDEPRDAVNAFGAGVPSTSRQVPRQTASTPIKAPRPEAASNQVTNLTRRREPTYNVGIRQQQPAVEAFKYFKVISQGTKLVKKFNLMAKTVTLKLADVGNEASGPALWLKNAFTEIIDHMVADASPSDRVGLVIHSDKFPEKPIGISFRRVDQLSVEVVMAVLDKILQSNASFFSQDALRIQLDRVSLPVGGHGPSREKLTGVSYEEYCRRKKGIMVVNNDDNQCLARALVLAMAWRANDPQLVALEKGYPEMDRRTHELCTRARVDLSQGGTRDHIEQFQQYLVNHTIVVYNNRQGKTVYYEGPRHNDKPVLNLILENAHYNVITNLCSAFSTHYFCEMCRIRSSNKTDHKGCKYICPSCHTSPPCNVNVDLVKCNECHRDFRGQACFTEHTKNLCKALRRCPTCLYSVWTDKKSNHKCGFKYCSRCRSEQPIRHLCHMSKNVANKKKLDKHFGFVFYDFECRQDSLVDGTDNVYLHQPNLCVVQNVCKSCIDDADINKDCSKCGKRQHIFRENPVDELLNFILKFKKSVGSVVALAHNAKGYDSQFVLRRIINQKERWNPKIISNGTKLMSISCGEDIKFLDSLNYMPMPLSKLPKTFGFQGSKGFFPHFFNTLGNQNYVGPMPATHYYGADEMATSTRSEFLAWYRGEVERDAVFNLQEELVRYCISDVDILRKACLEFWRSYCTSNGVDPFREACTIAGSCNAVFRRKFLTADTIGLIPPNGYRMADKQSAIAIKWLLYLEHSLDIQIKHAGNSREVKLREGCLVDGFCEATNTVYQFQGCYYHGCEACFPDQTAQLGGDKNETMFMRREKTEATSARIRSYGYNLVEMKECRFKNFLKTNIQAAEFLANHNVIRHEPLNPRNSFFGGRTNAIKLHHKVEKDEKIRYLDVCSLYPFVNKYGKYPIGHPKIHVGRDKCEQIDLNSVEGIVKCTIVPPTDLYHPVLPLRMHGKLMFVLCRTCAEDKFMGECAHTQDERQFTGTYVADELRKAISLGYRVIEILEVWEYKVAQYNKATKTGGLFSDYVNNFVKIKQECSGWPSWCTDDQAKDRYVSEYADREGVALDKGKIASNPGMRYIAKLCLNSFWGKFAQRENLMQSSIITDSNELFKKLTDPSVEVHTLTPVDDDTIILNWDRPDECIQPLNTVNVALAAYTTANARLELYKYLEKLGRRVLYFDTDSVIFTQRPGEWVPETGDFLGDMTDEIECYGPGSYIVEFVSGGPKNYAFKVFSTNKNGFIFICKVKGITLNFKNSESVNFETLKDMVLNDAEATYVQTDRKIVRTPVHEVVSKPERKVFRVQYTKRRRVEDSFDTLPFGYRT